MIEEDDAPSFAYTIYDRCLAEGKAAYQSGLGNDVNPYEWGSFEFDSWNEGYDP